MVSKKRRQGLFGKKNNFTVAGPLFSVFSSWLFFSSSVVFDLKIINSGGENKEAVVPWMWRFAARPRLKIASKKWKKNRWACNDAKKDRLWCEDWCAIWYVFSRLAHVLYGYIPSMIKIRYVALAVFDMQHGMPWCSLMAYLGRI